MIFFFAENTVGIKKKGGITVDIIFVLLFPTLIVVIHSIERIRNFFRKMRRCGLLMIFFCRIMSVFRK